MATIIGRKLEQEELRALFEREQSQLVAVYGRRRVGKTFLIRETFKNDFAFYHTGLSPVELEGKNLLEAQLQAFAISLNNYGFEAGGRPANWPEAFHMLRQHLENKSSSKRYVVFIDEMPWLDTPRSGFITAFESFWNGWGSGQDNLMLIVCGSASSWIKDNLINSPGGLYDRVSTDIQLSPFTLAESRQLLELNNISYSNYDMMEIYMAVGGIPYYLNQLLPGLSAAEQIDRLFFSRKAKLKDEFDKLFNSTFSNPDITKKIVLYLASRHSGFSRNDISQKIGVQGQELTKLLKSLEAGDFIQKYQPFGAGARELQYRLTDPFCWFWIKQVESTGKKEHYWRDNYLSASTHTWRGIAFEEVCLLHTRQIKQALGIADVSTKESSWIVRPTDFAQKSGTDSHNGAQIDMIIERADNMVHLCEMKYCNDMYSVDLEEEMKMRRRIIAVQEKLKKLQSIQTTLITTFGLKTGKHSGIFTRTVTMDNFF